MAKPTELSRAERKSKKRAIEDTIPDLPGDDAEANNSDSEKKSSKKRKRDRDAEPEDTTVSGEGEKEKKKAKKEKKEKKAKGEEKDVAAEEEVPEEKASKKSKKEKKAKTEGADVIAEPADVVMGEGEASAEGGEAPKKSKKERKAERRAAELAAGKEGDSTPKKTKAVKAEGETKGGAKTETADAEKKPRKNNRNREKKRNANLEAVGGGDAAAAEEKNHRFIVFVGMLIFCSCCLNAANWCDKGNLPFTATKDSIRKHFASVQPKSIRPLTEKTNPTKCKGTAFVEFEGYDHMKTCLKLFHHSEFNDGISAARKINVELTYVPLHILSIHLPFIQIPACLSHFHYSLLLPKVVLTL